MNGYRKGSSAIVICCVLSVTAVADSPGLGPEPVFSAVVHGGFDVDGTSISSARGTPQAPGAPVNLTLQIPQGASVVAAFANWSYLTTAPLEPALRSITIDNTIDNTPVPDGAVTMVQSTTDDICSLPFRPGTEGVTATFFADVTGIVAEGFGQQTQATFTFRDIVETDDELVGPLGEGVSLLVVYEEPSLPLRLVNVYFGLIQTDGDSIEATAMLQFYDGSVEPRLVPYLEGHGPVHLFMNVLDGEKGFNEFSVVNQRTQERYGGFLNPLSCFGSGVWCGALGPTHSMELYFYDHGEARDFLAQYGGFYEGFMEQGDTSVGFKSVNVDDCIGHTVAAIAFDYVSCPRLYVDADRPLGGDGLSWETAYKYLQDALANIDPICETDSAEIWVAQGTYHPDDYEGNPGLEGDVGSAFELRDHIAVIGGFAGYGEPGPDLRDLANHPTILSGDLLDNDIPNLAEGLKCYTGDDCQGFSSPCVLPPGCDGPAPSVPDFDMDNDGKVTLEELNIDDNSQRVIIGDGRADSAVLDGFTISAATSAGIRVAVGAPTVRNCIVENNIAAELNSSGGGVHLVGFSGSPCTLTNCVFRNNVATFNGGGLSVIGAQPVVTNCTFAENDVHNPDPESQHVGEGAGLGVDIGGAPVVRNCIFWENTGGGTTEANQIVLLPGSIADIDYTDWQGHSLPDGNNVDDDPAFVSAPDDLRLKPSSPVHDIGDDASFPASIAIDLDGNPRFDGVIDLGAYELASCPVPLTFDVSPLDCTRDARQPHPINNNSLGARQGIGSPNGEREDQEPIVVDLGVAGADKLECWSLVETGIEPVDPGTPTPPLTGNFVEDVTETSTGVYEIRLNRPISGGEWTTITYLGEEGRVVTYGSLPANANGDEVSNSGDITSLINYINQAQQPPWGAYSTGIDHSGYTNSQDILRLIDLLNGAGAYVAWLGGTLDNDHCNPQSAMGGGTTSAELTEPDDVARVVDTAQENRELADAFVLFVTAFDSVDAQSRDEFFEVVHALTYYCLGVFNDAELAALADRLEDKDLVFASHAGEKAAADVVATVGA